MNDKDGVPFEAHEPRGVGRVILEKENLAAAVGDFRVQDCEAASYERGEARRRTDTIEFMPF
jgi:hypothetical protein